MFCPLSCDRIVFYLQQAILSEQALPFPERQEEEEAQGQEAQEQPGSGPGPNCFQAQQQGQVGQAQGVNTAGGFLLLVW